MAKTHVIYTDQQLVTVDEIITYNVAIDPRELENMAAQASRNKSNKCRDGALVVEVTKRRTLRKTQEATHGRTNP